MTHKHMARERRPHPAARAPIIFGLLVFFCLVFTAGDVLSPVLGLAQVPPTPDIVTLSAADDGAEITAQVGTIVVLSLPGNPSTGFVWNFVAGDLNVSETPASLEVLDRQFVTDSRWVGASGTEVIRLRVLREGRSTLRLAYRRPWATGRKTARTFTVDLRVDGVLKTPPAVPPPVAPLAATADGVRYQAVHPVRWSQAEALPTTFDWRAEGAVSPIRDQDACGSGWAFASVGVLESALLQHEMALDLSEQYLLGHNESGWSCEGGGAAHVYHSSRVPLGEREAGAVLESACPYTADDAPCPDPQPLRHPVTLDGWSEVPDDVAAIKAAIYHYGPVMTTICAGYNFSVYTNTSGVFEYAQSDSCSLDSPTNHAVMLVGWDDSAGDGGAWILRNSWGTDWGYGGYMTITYGTSNVGLDSSFVQYDGLVLDPRAQVGGGTAALDVEGDYAYVGAGSRLAILDVSQPMTPLVAGESVVLPELPAAVEVSGTFALVLAEGFHVFDVGDVAAPERVGFYNLGTAVDVAVSGALAYVADGQSAVGILDIAEVQTPTLLITVETPGTAEAIAVSGEYAYVADGLVGLTVLDVSFPPTASVVTSLSLPLGVAYDVDVQDDYAYVVYGQRGLRVIDISDPANPQVTGTVGINAAYGVTVSGNRAYVATRTQGMQIVDISDPASPTVIGSVPTAGSTEAVRIQGAIAYLAEGVGGLRIVDVTDAGSPDVLADHRGLADVRDVVRLDDIVVAADYVATELQVLDVADIAAPRTRNIVQTAGSPQILALAADHLFVAEGTAGLEIYDLNETLTPTLAGALSGSAYDVAVAGDMAYLAAGITGLRVVDVSDPAAPQELGTFGPLRQVERLAHVPQVTSGDYVLIAEPPTLDGTLYVGGGILVVDVSDPENPTQVGFYDTPAYARDVVVAGTYAYVVDSDLPAVPSAVLGGVMVLDISEPQTPTLVATMPASFAQPGLTVADGFLTVWDADQVRVYDVRNPANPRLFGTLALPSAATAAVDGVAVADDVMWVGASEAGLYAHALLWNRDVAYIPASGGTLLSKPADTAIAFPNGAFVDEAAVTYRHLWRDPQLTDLAGIGHTFHLTAVDHLSNLTVTPALSYTVTITYTPGVVQEDTLGFYAWDEGAALWLPVPTRGLDTDLNVISATLDALGTFSILGYAGPQTVTIAGPEVGAFGQPITFTAQILPVEASLPITVVWAATGGVSPVTHTVNALSDAQLSDEHTFSWPITGTQELTVTATNPWGMATATHAITLYDAAQPLFSATPLTGVAPLAVTFANLSTGVYDTCLWDFGDGATDDDCTAPVHTYATPGTFTVSLTLTGPGGVATRSEADYITAYTPATADFSATPTADVVPLYATFSNLSTGDYETCQWDFGNGDSSDQCAPGTRIYADPGAYTVTLTVAGLGGVDTLTRSNYITAYEPVVANFSATPLSGTAPLAVTFTNISTGDYVTCTWTFGDGAMSSLCDPTHTYLTKGAYTVTLTVRGPGGEDDEARPDYITVTGGYVVFLPLTLRQ